MAERSTFRYCRRARCGDGVVTQPPADGMAGRSAKAQRGAGKSTPRAEAREYAKGMPEATVLVSVLPRKSAKLQRTGTRTVNGHTWSG